jgi:predicted nucleic acid-binding protein
VETFLREVQSKATFIDPVPEVFTYPRDLDDVPSVHLAVAAGARYLVTWDNDLLDLMNEATPEGRDFRQRFPDLAILAPVAFLQKFSPKGEQRPPAEGPPSRP